MTQSPNSPMLPNGINNARAITTAFRLGLSVYRAIPALSKTQSNGPTLFWVAVRFHGIELSLARQIVEKYTSVTGTNWRAALEELDLLIVPF